MKWLLILVLAGIYSQAPGQKIYGGTTILGFITRDTVWLGADTKISMYGSGSTVTDRTNPNPIQKVHVLKNIGYGLAGWMNADKEPGITYDAFRTMTACINKYPDLFRAHRAFCDSVKKELTRLIQTIQNRYPAISIPDDKVLEILMVKMDTTPVTIHTAFRRVGSASSWRIEESSVVRSDYPRAIPVGRHAIIDLYLAGGVSTRSPIPQLIACLIEQEVKLDPVKVGMPVDVIMIYKGGHRRLQRQSSCVEYQ